MVVSGALMVLLFSLVLCTQALEQQSPAGQRSKRDITELMFSYIKKVDKRLTAVEASLDNSTEERLTQLEAKMEGELQEKLLDVDEKLRDVQNGMKRLEVMVAELITSTLEAKVTEILNSKLKSMDGKMEEMEVKVTGILDSKMKAMEDELTELKEIKTNATEEHLASLETSNTDIQSSPVFCRYQYLYRYAKESPRSSGDLQWTTKLETELTRLQEKISTLDKHMQDNDLSLSSFQNASLLAMEGVVHSMKELLATSEQNLQSIMQNTTEIMASRMNDAETRLLAKAENNAAVFSTSISRVEQTTERLTTRMSAVDSKMLSVKEQMTVWDQSFKSTMQNATEIMTSKMSHSESRLLAKLTRAENNDAVFSNSITRVEQTTKELATHMSTMEDKLDNATSVLTEKVENARTRCGEVQRQTKAPSNRKTEANGTEVYRRKCQDYYDHGQRNSGTYKLLLEAGQSPMEVYCDMSNGTGWVVFQRRQDGSVDFYRNWTSYEDGFGDLNGEFWVGNRNIHRLTSAGLTQLRVDLQAWDGSTAFASYSHFSVGDASSSYRLSVSGYSGTAGDSLTYHNGHKFSTFDQDQDASRTTHCAQSYKGAWWYNSCVYSNLNGEYGTRGSSGSKYVEWYHWLGYQSMQRTELKLK